jgi:hypothetical protein
MVAYAKANGVPQGDIRVDPAGSTTYETMANALTSLGGRTALVSTQRYHLPRAVYLARALGIEPQGFRPTSSPTLTAGITPCENGGRGRKRFCRCISRVFPFRSAEIGEPGGCVCQVVQKLATV